MSAADVVSVGVSTLNRPEALARCLDALFEGDLLPDEIIVVDQGDDAQTPAAVATRQHSNVRVKYVRQPHRGLSASRNAVVREATGTIVAVTDDDCVPSAGWVAAIARAFAEHPCPEAVSGRVLPLGAEREGMYAVSLRTSTHRMDFTRVTMPWRVSTGANFAIRRDRLLAVGGYDERLGAGSPGHAAEDLDLSLRLLRAGARIRYDPDVVVYHERQTKDRRLATRWSYAHGIGAACGMCCRVGDSFGVAMFGRWVQSVGGRAIRSMARRDVDAFRQATLSLRGTLRGFAYGWRVATASPQLPTTVGRGATG